MKILAVDTTTQRLKMALADVSAKAMESAPKVWSADIQASGRHDGKLLQETRRLLARAGWKIEDLECLVAASGPGSFTGIRVGMTFVGMLSRILDVPAMAVTLLEAEALRAVGVFTPEKDQVIAIAYPARNEELFFQAFSQVSSKPSRLKPLHAPKWLQSADWPAALWNECGSCRVLLTGPVAQQAGAKLGSLRARVEVRAAPPLAARHLIDAALKKLNRGKPGRAAEFSPLYLKPAYYERTHP